MWGEQGKRDAFLNDPDRPRIRFEAIQEQERAARRIGAGFSEASPKHPERNEDAFFVDAREGFMMIADGVGSSKRGDIASTAARDACAEFLPEFAAARNALMRDVGDDAVEKMQEIFRAHFVRVANRVRDVVARGVAPQERSAATTLMMASLFTDAQGNNFVLIANVGDGNVFVRRANGVVERVDVETDAYVNQWVRDELLTADELRVIANASSVRDVEAYVAAHGYSLNAAKKMMTLFAQYYGLPSANVPTAERGIQQRSKILQFVGRKDGASMDIHCTCNPVEPGEEWLLATDGISPITDEQFAHVLGGSGAMEERIRGVFSAVQGANTPDSVRAVKDDITVTGIAVPNEELRRAVAA